MALDQIAEASRLLQSAVPPQVAAAFRRLDLNGDGTVDLNEATTVLQALDPATFSDGCVRRLMEAVDSNHDGRIQLHEFLAWIFATGEDQRKLCGSMGLVAEATEVELERVGGNSDESMEPRDYNEYRLQPVNDIPLVPINGYVGVLWKEAPVGLLREELSKVVNIPAESFCFAYDGRDLDITKTLKDNGVLEPGPAARRRGARVEVSFQIQTDVISQVVQHAEELERAAAQEARDEETRVQADREAAQRLAEEQQGAEERRRAQLIEEEARRQHQREAAARAAQDRQMPALGFRRLMGEFRKVQKAMTSGELSWVVVCEPVEDNMLQWKVDMKFPIESAIQRTLANLAECVFDDARDRLSLQVRFPPEYPMSPPEVWLKQPRLKYQSGVPVTFGGKVCNHLLTSAGWDPATSMCTVLAEIRQALLDSGAEVDMAVSIKRPDAYRDAPPQLTRLRTELFPLANSFTKEGMTALSTTAAEPFMGDLSRLEATDKIGLPFEFAEAIYGRAAREETLELPLMFEVKTQLGRKTHCAIFDFIQGLPQDTLLLPSWVMEELSISDRAQVRVRCVSLSLISYVKVQPHSTDFYNAVRDSGQEIGPLLTESLSRFSALTEDTCVPIEIGKEVHKVQIVELRPHAAVRIIDADVQHHFEFQVDFEPSPDLEDEAAREAREKQLLAHVANREEVKAAAQREAARQLADARRRRFDTLYESMKLSAGAADGSGGDVELALRLPDGSQVRGKFPEGSPISAIAAFALQSPWAESSRPWNIHLMIPFPRRVLRLDETIGRDMHRSAVSVQEEREPADAEDILRQASQSAPLGTADIDAALPLQVPDIDETAAQQRTERAFEIQRFIQAGVEVEEAVRRYEAGERLSLTPAQRVAAEAVQPRPPLGGRPPQAEMQPLERALSAEERQDEQVRAVMNITGAELAQVLHMLEQSAWDIERAVNALLDAAT